MKTYPYPQDQIMEYLQEAADNGEVIQLTYYGGTRPGEARSVVPTTVYKTRFHGICIDSNIEKTYLYEKCYFPKMFGVQKRERQKFCVHGIIGARQSGASNEHEHQTQFS